MQPAPNHTVLARDGARIRVTEHLLAALWAAGIDTAEVILLEGSELPNFDGSALPFYDALLSCGRSEHGLRPLLGLDQPLVVEGSGASFELTPASALEVHYSFDHPQLGAQDFSCLARRETAATELLPARTFATAEEVAQAQAAGLLQNTNELAGLVIRDGIPNQPLRFPNEYARHKVLDLLGDLYLLPFDWPCRVRAMRTGHAMNHQLARRLMQLWQQASGRTAQ